MVRFSVQISLQVPSTPEDWALYTQVPHAATAAQTLTRALKLAVLEVTYGETPERAYLSTIAPIAGRYEAMGACDQEARKVAMDVLNRLAEISK